MRIGIVGDGISGLHLALRLQQFGVATTLYGARPPEAVRQGRALNFVARSGATRRREARLGVDLWDAPQTLAGVRTITVHSDPPSRFRADPDPAYSLVDFRIYLPALAEEYVARGGRYLVADLGSQTVAGAAAGHDLVVVAGGRASGELFERDPERSPFHRPQRLLCGGLYHGIGEEIPQSIELHVLPGVGEILRMPFHSLEGRVDVLGLEGIPGGPLDPVCRLGHDADPAGFHRAVLAVLERYVPELRERVDTSAFALTRPIDLVQGALVPTVRRPWRGLPGGRYALALGDALALNDPITAQGANLGSHCALALADAIVAHDVPFDEAFCRMVERRLRDEVDAVVQWTNSFLRPPEPHLRRLFQAAGSDPAVAAAFAANFDRPRAMWQSIAGPEQTERFLAGVRGVVPAPSAAGTPVLEGNMT